MEKKELELVESNLGAEENFNRSIIKVLREVRGDNASIK